MKAVIFGAGNIGRGFLGLLLAESGFSVTFVDINERQVSLLNQEGSYPVYIVGADCSEERVVSGVSAISALDNNSITQAIVGADLILTAVGKKALSVVAVSIANGLEARMKLRPRDEIHVAVIACENVHDNTAYLVAEMLKHVAPESKEALLDAVSFPNCMVDRIVPNISDESVSPLAVWVEDYYRLAIDAQALRGVFPQVRGVEVVDNLEALLEQKLFTLNMAHAIVGYFGWISGCEFVHEAVSVNSVKELLDGALTEVSHLLCERHSSITEAEQELFSKTVVNRFSNSCLVDSVRRVTSDPKRKLGTSDRLVSPATLLMESGYHPSFLTAGIASALLYRNPDDRESQELECDLGHQGVARTVEVVCGLSRGKQLSNSVISHYLLRNL